MKVLVINCGSSSVKFKLYALQGTKVLAGGVLENIGEEVSPLVYQVAGVEKTVVQHSAHHRDALDLILELLLHDTAIPMAGAEEITAVGHRVVHGAEKFTKAVVLTDTVIAGIKECSSLAPLHNVSNLMGIQAAQHALPHALQVGCFDTAFHQSIPPKAYHYALPHEYYQKYHIRRYGFHGMSHQYAARRVAQLLQRPPEEVHCITCHLGNGCSIAAVAGGESVDTSMGFTPLEGVVMGTRCGDIDPALIFFMTKNCGLSIDEIDTLLNKKSGLLGLSGISNDIRAVHIAALAGNAKAQLALDIFMYRIRKYVGAYTAVLGTLDAVVFTGGIGEHASFIREGICKDLTQIGITVDTTLNSTVGKGEQLISTTNSRVKVYVIPADEEGEIAKATYALADSIKI